MRTFFSTLALVASMSLMAQDADMDNDKKTPEERAKHRTEVMTKELGLDAEQVAKVNTINLNFARYMGEVKAIKEDEARKGRAAALKSNRDAKLKEVLSAEQYAKMEELRDKKKDENKEKKEGKKAHQE